MESESAMMAVLRSIANSQERIAQSLEAIAYGVNILVADKVQGVEPKLKRKLDEYRNFDWVTIGAEVVGHDEYGATEVMWGGHTWGRRRSKNEDQYGQAIWFNRTMAGEDGGAKYLKLITFAEKTATIKPISADLKERLPAAIAVKTIEKQQQIVAVAAQPKKAVVGNLDSKYADIFNESRGLFSEYGVAIDNNRFEAFYKRVGVVNFRDTPIQHKHALAVQVLNTFIKEKEIKSSPEIEAVGLLLRSSPSPGAIEIMERAIDCIKKTETPF